MADPKGYLVVPVGFRADGSLHALELDNSDHLKVVCDPITGTLTIQGADSGAIARTIRTDTTGHILVDAEENTFLHPVGGVASVTNLSLAAGSNALTLFTVPASQRYQLSTVAMAYTGTVAGVTLQAIIVRSAVNYYIADKRGIASANVYPFPFNIIMEAGDVLNVAISGATLNDDGFGWATYNRIK